MFFLKDHVTGESCDQSDGERQLDHFHVVGGIEPLPAIVLQAATPALVVFVLDLQEVLACTGTHTSALRSQFFSSKQESTFHIHKALNDRAMIFLKSNNYITNRG